MDANIGIACSTGNTCCAAEPSTSTNTACSSFPIRWTRPSTACATTSSNTTSNRIRFCNSAYNLPLNLHDQINCSQNGPPQPRTSNAPKEVLYGLDQDAIEHDTCFRFGWRLSAIWRRDDNSGG